MLLNVAMHASLGRSEARLVPLRDVAQVAQREAVDWDVLASWARRWHLTAVLRDAFSTACRVLGAVVPEGARPLLALEAPKSEVRALEAYQGERRFLGGTPVMTLRAIPGIANKSAYVWALAVPDHEFLRARTNGSGKATYRRRWSIAMGWASGRLRWRRDHVHREGDRGSVDGSKSDERKRCLMEPVGVVGLGVVGGALKEALEATGIVVRVYDPYQGQGAPERLADCSLVFVCVPTPSTTTGELDTSAVWKAVRDVEACLPDDTIVAIRSTVPPGTSDALTLDFPRFEFASLPEFLVASRPLESLTKPDRVLIGARSARAAEAIAAVMRRISPGAPVLILSPTEAELAKLFANAMLAAKVSMANEFALICDRFGVAWSDVQAAVGLDRRIGVDHLTVTPERGFGGGCFPKDLEGLIAASRQAGHEAALLSSLSGFNSWVRGSDVGDAS